MWRIWILSISNIVSIVIFAATSSPPHLHNILITVHFNQTTLNVLDYELYYSTSKSIGNKKIKINSRLLWHSTSYLTDMVLERFVTWTHDLSLDTICWTLTCATSPQNLLVMRMTCSSFFFYDIWRHALLAYFYILISAIIKKSNYSLPQQNIFLENYILNHIV